MFSVFSQLREIDFEPSQTGRWSECVLGERCPGEEKAGIAEVRRLSWVHRKAAKRPEMPQNPSVSPTVLAEMRTNQTNNGGSTDSGYGGGGERSEFATF